MDSTAKKMTHYFNRRHGTVVITALGVATVGAIALACELPIYPAIQLIPPRAQRHQIPSAPGPTARVTLPSGVKVSGSLSQTKLVQGSNGEVYLSLQVSTPVVPSSGPKVATDTVVVLDHSGSMASDNRLPFAKKAIHDLIDRMTPEDRVGLVIFDSGAQTLSHLTATSEDGKKQLHAVVDTINHGSGTNMSAGIEMGRALLSSKSADRNQKLILLSDGEANEGVTEPRALGTMASAINQQNGSFSTIGMGLGFNEQLMASLADFGGGSFSYLEHLERLAEILDRNVADSRKMYASQSTIELTLKDGVTVRDTGGFPIAYTGQTAIINTGQLLSGTERQFTLTFNVPTSTLGSVEIGKVAFQYADGNEVASVQLPVDGLQLAVLEQARRSEAVASMNQAVYKDSWITNNLGIAKLKIRDLLLKGDVAAAKREVGQYEQSLKGAQVSAGLDLADDKVSQELRAIEAEIGESSRGNAQEQEKKQNSLRKKYFYEGRSMQRGETK